VKSSLRTYHESSTKCFFTQIAGCDIITPKEGVELEAEVTRQANDVIMKAVAGAFKDKNA